MTSFGLSLADISVVLALGMPGRPDVPTGPEVARAQQCGRAAGDQQERAEQKRQLMTALVVKHASGGGANCDCHLHDGNHQAAAANPSGAALTLARQAASRRGQQVAC